MSACSASSPPVAMPSDHWGVIAVGYVVEKARELTARERRNESGKFMREADQGESIIVTGNGMHVGELTPLHRRWFVSAKAVASLFRTAPTAEYGRFREALDAVADQDPTPRA